MCIVTEVMTKVQVSVSAIICLSVTTATVLDNSGTGMPLRLDNPLCFAFKFCLLCLCLQCRVPGTHPAQTKGGILRHTGLLIIYSALLSQI